MIISKVSNILALACIMIYDLAVPPVETAASGCGPISKEAQIIIDSQCNITTIGLTIANIAVKKRAAIVKEVTNSNKCPYDTIKFLYDNFTLSQARNSAQDLIYALWADYDLLCVNGFHALSIGDFLKETCISIIFVTLAKDKHEFRSKYFELFHENPEDTLLNVTDAALQHYVKTITTTGPTKIDGENPTVVAQKIIEAKSNLKSPEGRAILDFVYFSLSADFITAVENEYKKLNKNTTAMFDTLSKTLPQDYIDLYNAILTSLTWTTSYGDRAGFEHNTLILNAFAEFSCLLRFYAESVCYVSKCAYFKRYHETLKDAIKVSRAAPEFKATVNVYVNFCCTTYGGEDCTKDKP